MRGKGGEANASLVPSPGASQHLLRLDNNQ